MDPTSKNSSSKNIYGGDKQINSGSVIACADESSTILSLSKSCLLNPSISSGGFVPSHNVNNKPSAISPLSVSSVDNPKEVENKGPNNNADKFPAFLQQLSKIAAEQLENLGQSHQDAKKDCRNDTNKSTDSCKQGSTPQHAETTPTKAGLPINSSGVGKQKQKRQRPKPRKDRSNLRKGKWTVEEEEYTSRIIHHFRAGLLTLPEGMTLRSYLASKLSCDPMRITKKFAGASCLGKRIYHLCERSQITINDIEIARVELAQLEQRFRLRVEHGQSGIPLPPRVGGSIMDHSGQSLVNGGMHPGHCTVPGSEGMGHVWPPTFTMPTNINAVGLNPLLLQAMACQQQQQQQQLQQQQQQQQQRQHHQQQQQQQQQNAVPWLAMQTPFNLSLLTNLIINAQQAQKLSPGSPDLFNLQQFQGIAASNPQMVPVDIKSQQLQAITSNSNVTPQLPPPGILHNETEKQAQMKHSFTDGSLFGTSLHTETGKQAQEVNDKSAAVSLSPTSAILCSEDVNNNSNVTQVISYESQGATARVASSKDEEIRERVDDQLPCKKSNANRQKAKQRHTQEDEDAGRTLLEFLRELQKNHSKAISEDRSQRGSAEEVTTLKDSSLPKSSCDENVVPSLHPKAFVKKLPKRKRQLTKSTFHNDASVVTASVNDSVTSCGSVKNSGNSFMHQEMEVPVQCFETSSALSTTISKTSDISRGGTESSSYSESNMEQNCSEESDSSKSHVGSSEGTKESSNKGPVRKRFKRSAFTSRNVEDHNNRMDALRNEDTYSKRF